ncbi:MAG: hypothetical protein ACE5FV_06525 [Woeseia sp.]
MRSAFLLGIVTTVLSIDVAADPRPAQRIYITADIPTVPVQPRRAGRVAFRLPTLTYALTLTSYCDENWQPASVSINVADSRMSIDAEQLRSHEAIDVQLRIPSNQIAPLRIERFCVEEDMDGIRPDDRFVTIPAALSAQASLLCVLESERSITYVTKPLDVTLECQAPEVAAE